MSLKWTDTERFRQVMNPRNVFNEAIAQFCPCITKDNARTGQYSLDSTSQAHFFFVFHTRWVFPFTLTSQLEDTLNKDEKIWSWTILVWTKKSRTKKIWAVQGQSLIAIRLNSVKQASQGKGINEIERKNKRKDSHWRHSITKSWYFDVRPSLRSSHNKNLRLMLR